jgi:hypothetical protein
MGVSGGVQFHNPIVHLKSQLAVRRTSQDVRGPFRDCEVGLTLPMLAGGGFFFSQAAVGDTKAPVARPLLRFPARSEPDCCGIQGGSILE